MNVPIIQRRAMWGRMCLPCRKAYKQKKYHIHTIGVNPGVEGPRPQNLKYYYIHDILLYSIVYRNMRRLCFIRNNSFSPCLFKTRFCKCCRKTICKQECNAEFIQHMYNMHLC